MKLIHEVFNEIALTKSVKAKQQLLRQWETPALKVLLRCMMDTNIKFKVTTIPKYIPTDDPIGYSVTTLEKECRYLPYLYEGSNLTEQRATNMLQDMLESMYHEDAEILSRIVKGKFKVAGLTKRLVHDTFPELLTDFPLESAS